MKELILNHSDDITFITTALIICLFSALFILMGIYIEKSSNAERAAKLEEDITFEPVREVFSLSVAGNSISWMFNEIRSTDSYPMIGKIHFDINGGFSYVKGEDGKYYSPLCFTKEQREKIVKIGGDFNA